jgi:VanZ family protein
VARIWLTPFAAFFAIASTFAVACLDEWHQTFGPGRVGSLHDALLDAAGAIFLNAIFWASIARSGRRHLKRARMEA